MSEKKQGKRLFNLIAPVYGLFYKSQKKHYAKVIDEVGNILDLTEFRTVVDVGCGTGALCSVLNEKGMEVTGLDPASRMLEVARGKAGNKGVNFVQADVLERLPFEDKSFDISIASYVAHGLDSHERQQMYAEMSRVAREWVIIHDYNDKRSPFVSFVEWLEGGDYFHFIKNAEAEMKDCLTELEECFSQVDVVSVGARANWYIGKPAGG